MIAKAEQYLVLILLSAIFLTGCSSAAKNATLLNSAEAQTSAHDLQEYRIQPGDELNIKFFYNPELNESQVVRPDGRISLQLVSEIVAAGLTPSELTTVLEERYASELEMPEIAVIVRSFNGQRFFVDGEVSRPGLFTLIGPTTVLDSIAQAGGFRDTARKHEIVIIRQGVDKKPIVLHVNLNNVIDGTDMSQNLVIQPYDIVFVPKSAIANVNMFVEQYIRKNIPVSITLGYYLDNQP